MNKIFIDGRLTRDPEIKSPGQSEYSVIKFSIANDDETRKNNNGDYENISSFFDCEYWTKNPQYWAQRMYKGTYVSLEGSNKQNRWTTQEGESRSKVIIKVFRIWTTSQPQNRTENTQPAEPEPTNEHIPF